MLSSVSAGATAAGAAAGGTDLTAERHHDK